MKKTYMTPDMDIINLQNVNVLCASVETTFNPNVDDLWYGDIPLDPELND